jgi:uncharacterized phiE125 gp8 family phage protein
MALSLIEPPEYEPISLGEVKAQTRVDHDIEDSLLMVYIRAARVYAEGQTRRVFVPQVWEWSGNPEGEVLLPVPPVISIDSVSVDGYEFQDGSPVSPLWSAETRGARTYVSGDWQGRAVAIRFTAGYEEVPDDIRLALMLLVSHFYEIRQPAIVGTSVGRVPMSVDALLSPYNVMSF